MRKSPDRQDEPVVVEVTGTPVVAPCGPTRFGDGGDLSPVLASTAADEGGSVRGFGSSGTRWSRVPGGRKWGSIAAGGADVGER